MTDGEIVATVLGALGAGGTALLGFGRWLGGVWRDIRKQEIVVARENAAENRKQLDRLHDVMLESARASATMTATLSAQMQHVLDMFEHTPVDQPSPIRSHQRSRTSPQGFRPPRPGNHDD